MFEIGDIVRIKTKKALWKIYDIQLDGGCTTCYITPINSEGSIAIKDKRLVLVEKAKSQTLKDIEIELKATNPKDTVGSSKLPLHLWPETATALGCLGLLDGALKYGRSNFRAVGVRATVYIDAAKRHINAWAEGEECDPDSKLPHMAHALACLAIIVEATAKGNLNDDRMYPTEYRKWIEDLTPHVSRLKELHKDKDPKHYTIQDKE